jgi:hypothetical protein
MLLQYKSTKWQIVMNVIVNKPSKANMQDKVKISVSKHHTVQAYREHGCKAPGILSAQEVDIG